MKKIILLLITIFAFTIKVNASSVLSQDNVYLECIYSNGSIVSFDKGSFYYEVSSYQSTNYSVSTDTIFYPGSISALTDDTGYLACPNKLSLYVSEYSVDNENRSLYFVSFPNVEYDINDFYKYIEEKNYLLEDVGFFNRLKIVIGKKFVDDYALVSEELLLPSDLEFNLTCDYVQAKSQTILSDSYVFVSRTSNGQVFIDTNNKTTNIFDGRELFSGSTCPQTIYLNDSYFSYDVENKKMDYEANNPRYRISTSKSSINYNKYELIEDLDPTIKNDLSSEACKDIPQTVVIIRNIIKYMRILVPIFIVVLTIFDLVKLVSSSKIIDDEKIIIKHIRNRIILALIFVFLPTIINIILKLLFGAGILPVSNINCFFM